MISESSGADHLASTSTHEWCAVKGCYNQLDIARRDLYSTPSPSCQSHLEQPFLLSFTSLAQNKTAQYNRAYGDCIHRLHVLAI